MKIRESFVTNSSSSSFIISFNPDQVLENTTHERLIDHLANNYRDILFFNSIDELRKEFERDFLFLAQGTFEEKLQKYPGYLEYYNEAVSEIEEGNVVAKFYVDWNETKKEKFVFDLIRNHEVNSIQSDT